MQAKCVLVYVHAYSQYVYVAYTIEFFWFHHAQCVWTGHQADVYIYIHTYTYIHVYIHIHAYVYIYIYIHTRIASIADVCVRAHLPPKQIHTYTHTHTHTHEHKYTHKHTYTYTPSNIHTYISELHTGLTNFQGRNALFLNGLLVCGPREGFRTVALSTSLILVPAILFLAFPGVALISLSPAFPAMAAVLLFATLLFLGLAASTDPGILPRARKRRDLDPTYFPILHDFEINGVQHR
jgi:hypothetical protein